MLPIPAPIEISLPDPVLHETPRYRMGSSFFHGWHHTSSLLYRATVAFTPADAVRSLHLGFPIIYFSLLLSSSNRMAHIEEEMAGSVNHRYSLCHLCTECGFRRDVSINNRTEDLSRETSSGISPLRRVRGLWKHKNTYGSARGPLYSAFHLAYA